MFNQKSSQEKSSVEEFKHENHTDNVNNKRFEIALRKAYERIKKSSTEESENKV